MASGDGEKSYYTTKLAPRSGIHVEKLIVTQLVHVCGTCTFITIRTGSHHWILS
jgi:hypothetical protein